ncbi:J domain-containing protein [Lysinibacter cavernae]|uniref:J domain-containing protein n=1 Tax=Lysinibacter cavernae TaxID=1640652 RepID=A0A7X5R183_9MICO|nr:DnaJ domain-containing protein [Lysinibacter cavernae]NIH53637.1 hypothetical protein [Lysinibacter cavernae]
MGESAAERTPYEVLGVAVTVSAEDLRRAYRRLARETHPDAGGTAVRFHAVQAAWELLGDEAKRSAYDRGSDPAASRARAAPAAPESGTRLRARSFGVPGREARDAYRAWMRDWAETAAGMRMEDILGWRLTPDLFEDPAVIRSAPLPARLLLARAHAAEATARTVASLGMGFSVWHDVAVPGASASGAAGASGAPTIDHVVLGATGLFAVRSADWGSEVRLVRDELTGPGLGDSEYPLRDLARNAGLLSRSLGIRFTGLLIVVPDAALPGVAAEATQSAKPLGVVVRRSVLPQLLREGLGGTERTSLGNVYEYRARLQQGIRHGA